MLPRKTIFLWKVDAENKLAHVNIWRKAFSHIWTQIIEEECQTSLTDKIYAFFIPSISTIIFICYREKIYEN